RDLVVEFYLYHHQLDDLHALARALPDQRFVIDHIGVPLAPRMRDPQRAAVFQSWREHMRRAASCPNVALKIGGLLIDTRGAPWGAGDQPRPTGREIADVWGADVAWCLETFGPERCIFESNFPVDRMVGD